MSSLPGEIVREWRSGERHSGKGTEGILGGDPDPCTWVTVSLLPLPMQISTEPTQHRLSFPLTGEGAASAACWVSWLPDLHSPLCRRAKPHPSLGIWSLALMEWTSLTQTYPAGHQLASHCSPRVPYKYKRAMSCLLKIFQEARGFLIH